MKTILRLAMLAYPSEWRSRYGGELACLLEDAKSGWRDIFDVIAGGIAMRYTGTNVAKSAVIWGVTFGLLGFVLSGLVALRWPDVYRGGAIVIVQKGNALADLDDLRQMTGVLTDHQFERVVTVYDLYKVNLDLPFILMLRKPQPLSMRDRVELCKKDLQVEAVRNGAVLVSYQNLNPAIAAQVANQFAGLLIATNLKTRSGLRFTILDPARIPEKPFRPNRPLIVVEGLLCGMLLGVMIALLRRRPPVQLVS